MNWKTFFIKFFRHIVVGLVLGVVVLGLFGYLIGGIEGLVNMVYWGVALGLIGGFSSGIGMIFEAKYWGEGNYRMFPEWHLFVKKDADEGKRPNH